jgi:hypothetical protein
MQAGGSFEAVAGADARVRIPTFDGRDFGLWKMRAEGALMAADLLDTVESDADGADSSELPQTPARHALQGKKMKEGNDQTQSVSKDRRRQRAYGMLVQALQDEQLRLMSGVPRGDARALWRVLLDTYDRKSMAARVQLLEQLFAFVMTSGESVAAYAARLLELERRLKEQDESVSESILAYVLLRGLPERYASTVQWIKMQQEDAELKDIITIVRNEEERQQAGRAQRSAPAAAHAAHVEGACYTCGAPGHKKYDCPSNANQKKCSNCKRIGHTESECRRRHQGHSAVHFAS